MSDRSGMYYVEQDALDAAIEYPYELSPQQMVDKLIELMIMVPAEPDTSIADAWAYWQHIRSVSLNQEEIQAAWMVLYGLMEDSNERPCSCGVENVDHLWDGNGRCARCGCCHYREEVSGE